MPHLSLSLLGPFQATLDGQPITDFKSIKVRALLAYLAVEADRPHSRETLAGLLWPDYPNRTALDNLRYTLSSLRRAIADQSATPPFLCITRETVQFNLDSDYDLDVRSFQRHIADRADPIVHLRNAIELYQGSFLEGFSLGDSAPFEEWALLKREQLEQQMLAALHALAAFYEQCGEYQRAERYARRQVELIPWDEEAHRQLMRLLAFTGQSSAALSQYEFCRRQLIDELGVEPSASTTALYESIRDGKLIAPTRSAIPPQLIDQAEALAQPIVVARDNELARLQRSLDAALKGHGQIDFVIGEPGCGKTVLMHEFARRAMVAHYDLIVIQGHCNAQAGVGDPYLPFLEALRMLAGDIEAQRAGGTITQEHARRLWVALPDVAQTLIEHGPDLIDRFVPGTALIGHAEVAAPDRAAHLQTALNRLASAPPRTLQQLDLLTQYTRVLKIVASRHPVMLVIDDLQWADVGSIGLLFHLARQLAGSRILLIGTYRPGDIAQRRSGQRHPLEPIINELQREFGDIHIDLDQAAGSVFIDQLLDSEPNQLGAAFRETLYRHTGGQPLFTVELLRGLQERGDLIRDEGGRWREGSDLNWGRLPTRVEAVIAERIARLPIEWQRSLEIASVEGEEFTAEVVARVQGIDATLLRQRLSGELSKHDRLASACKLEHIEEQPLSHYRFRHSLFQKFLYNRLDQIERAQFHAAIGASLESVYKPAVPAIAARLAWHFEAAGLTAKAIQYRLEAGHQATRLYANDEAIAHYRRGLELLQSLPESSARDAQEIKFQVALGVPLVAKYLFAAPEVEQVYARARQLCLQMEATPDLFSILSGLKGYYDLRCELRTTRELGDQMLRLAQQQNDPDWLLVSHAALTITATSEGEFVQFNQHFEHVLNRYDAQRHRDLVYRFGFDPYIRGLSYAAWALSCMGYPDQALQRGREALTAAEKLSHPFMLASAMFFLAVVYHNRRDIQAVQEQLGATLEFCQQQNLTWWLQSGTALQGWAKVQQGQVDSGIVQLCRAMADMRAAGGEYGYVKSMIWLVEAHSQAGQVSQGLAAVDEALTLTSRAGFMMETPELHRLKGELILRDQSRRMRAEEAARCFQAAIDTARQQRAKLWELRATLSLCRLLRQQGEGDEARRQLGEIYSWFTEGLNTSDLKEAKAFLEELA